MTPEEKKERKRQSNREYLKRLREDPIRYAKRVAKTREWQQAHPEAYAKAKKKWNERNPDYYVNWHAKHPTYYADYREEHREELAEYGRQWRAKEKAKRPLHPCQECGEGTRNRKFCSHSCSGKASQRNR